MTWKDEHGKKYGVLIEIISTMVCDHCQKEQEWNNENRDYERPSEETILICKGIDGWANIGIHRYGTDPKEPCMIDCDAETFHLCPDCVKKLGLVPKSEGRS
ncbi:MAG: hypothetical protein UY48_C0011G0037 [Candidatus Gottesmanbacteria bacterium GW2011_GWB1_49_7]|uniref:Uncharacterized protein n=1 Tax=Candidatus Gottesmanbacteria bacterium GW2011_GWB1_49_7 TaxID=1618448 RepID=A0A0G1W1Y1_9BACT|nr:MAG: hypothetical protein UY48_C0011G0037 [Candidatus Gottesmanbacteria bacterium GW2011_GWB1_49_7]